ncbi:ABC transporter substrate-binding protein [Chamaesiphon minutus]|uniref:ABC-type branched-chain amino acid transport system, periplasmic component n=1 Tax=Chamaesiphon minutus (strain ATCC 27169 / PCC 6605) TaxID=1173020 RepID=K9UGE9_CHAP6|nr:ABC transporter substrate-binding protein [Chamaesiphon minutus]AFY93738.1 ABC-type branched-chain amino acid transport system, periplasmic component [Chamaesiphon minutus PCC 6605]
MITNPRRRIQPKLALAMALLTAITGLLTTSCTDPKTPGTGGTGGTTTTGSTDGQGLKIGTLLSSTGDLASIAQPLPIAVKMAVDTVNSCGGINGAPVTLISEDDQSDPSAGAAAMTKLSEVDKVAGVVGAFGSGISTAAANVAVQKKVMIVSPGSTSPVFTERAKKGEYQGYWARTAPPDTYQAQAMAQLAIKRGFKRVATIAINNDYGVGFEQQFVTSFKKLGGTVTNEAKPTRYDAKGTTFDSEVKAAFEGKPQAVAALVYPDTGSILLKAAYEQGLSKNVTIMLPDGAYSPKFPDQVGKSTDGKFIIAGSIGTVPGAHGKALEDFNKKWTATGKPLTAYLQHSWDAAALIMLAAQAAKTNTGEGIASQIREIAGGSGEEVSDLCQAITLLKAGKKINYQGASGNVDIDAQGDVIGTYDIWQVEPDGTLKTIDKVDIAGAGSAPKSETKPSAKPAATGN